MRKTLYGLSVLLLAACGAQDNHAKMSSSLSTEQKQAASRSVVSFFFDGCVDQQGSEKKVADWAITQGFALLDNEARQKAAVGLIEPDAAQVWQIQRNGSEILLSLSNNGCSVKAISADESTVRRLFMERVKQAKPGRSVHLRGDNHVAEPFAVSQLAYAWWQNGDSQETLLSVNTSPTDQSLAQAVLNYTRQPMQMQAGSISN